MTSSSRRGGRAPAAAALTAVLACAVALSYPSGHGLAAPARGSVAQDEASVRSRRGSRGLDLTDAVVVTPGSLSPPEEKAVAMLIEEVERRSGVRWTRAAQGRQGAPSILVERRSGGSERPREGYAIQTAGAPTRVAISGNDARGLLFGVGRLLRTLALAPGRVALPSPLTVETAPRFALRGHQLGYRPKTNSYDGWTVAQWEKYVRDLAVFGANAIELIPPRSDDDATSPLMPLPPMEMMVAVSGIAASYGLDVWVWSPAMEPDYSDPAVVDRAVREWGEIWKRLPRLDAVMVPGGDPGKTPPHLLIPLLERQAAELRRHHPRATFWLSPQSFVKKELDDLFARLDDPRVAAWLTGLVYGPQTRVSLRALGERFRGRYPIRHYPDITHTLDAQFPVPDWDPAWAFTLGREPINPRPIDQAIVFRREQRHSFGFITYSEGCNDDFNKALWSALGWDPDADVRGVVAEYGRYFIGGRHERAFGELLFGLERNWRGPALRNRDVEATFARAERLERVASPTERDNWRLQQALYRAYYDVYVQRRLRHETAMEGRALASLRRDGRPTQARIAEAQAWLARSESERPERALRERIVALADDLFRTIRMQLSVERHKAKSVRRGANLDDLDAPLNDRVWLGAQLREISALADEPSRRGRLQALLERADPGPGGRYDDLGHPGRQPHLVPGAGFAHDPNALESAVQGFVTSPPPEPIPLAWRTFASGRYDHPVRLEYRGLDRRARYRVRAVHASGEVALDADGLPVHPMLDRRFDPVEHPIPAEATADGALTLTWRRPPGAGPGSGVGSKILEVLLLRERPETRASGRSGATPPRSTLRADRR